MAEGKALDYETATEHSITVRVSDGNTTANAEITIKVTEGTTNEAPVIEAQEFTAKEDITDADVIGTVTATDADEDELTFELKENDNDLFLLNEAGELTLAEGKTLDYETATEHSITVSVTDAEATAEATVTITVENVIESMAEDPASFVTTWKTETDGEEIKIVLDDGFFTYNYTIDWGDGTVEELTEADGNLQAHAYATAGIYTMAIQGEFPRILMQLAGESKYKLMSLEQWGDIQWKSFDEAFVGCSNMVYNATDVPDLSQVTDMSGMFQGATSFNGDLSAWDVSNVTSMSYMFKGATSFNGDLGNWDVSNVTYMRYMFNEATSFNGDLSAWDVSNVTDMNYMFWDATSFNGDISGWDVSNVTNMSFMFNGATSFDQDLGGWDIGSVEFMGSMLDNSGMSALNFSNTLIGWAGQEVQPDVSLGAAGVNICEDGDGLTAYVTLSDAPNNWTITYATTEVCN